jgi:L-arabinose isomerase
MTGEWLAHCSACPVPEIANVFNRARVSFHQVTGMLRDDPLGCGESVTGLRRHAWSMSCFTTGWG